jgi:hypothetical protein
MLRDRGMGSAWGRGVGIARERDLWKQNVFIDASIINSSENPLSPYAELVFF